MKAFALIVMLALDILVAPLAAETPPSAHVPRIGLLDPGSPLPPANPASTPSARVP